MDLSSYIDHTILKPDCNLEDIQRLCEEVEQHHFAAACVPPFFVNKAAQQLDGLPAKVATVVGFPFGYSSTPAKVEEVKKAIDEGADEIDAVINICALKSGNWNYLTNDIESVVTAARLKSKVVKIIIESSLLSEEEIRKLSSLCVEAGANYVKTSTGFNGQGATLEAVRLIREVVGDKAKIKASGGIKTGWEARQFIEAGADRIGTSSGPALLE
jgi:deoxyribose-phosphate aldolase